MSSQLPTRLGWGAVSISSDPGPTVSVVIPTFNEARNIPLVFAELPNVHEVIVVDGGSHDDTVAVVRSLRPDARILMQNRHGKGNALACGFAVATGDIIVTLDADGSADPGEIQAFVDALMAGAQFAKGTRFAAGGGSSDITRLRRMGNKALNVLVNSLYGTNYTDLCYGYNAFWRDCLPTIDLRVETVAAEEDEMKWGDGFEVETMINVRIAKAGLRVIEVPSYERDRVHGVSNLNAVQDGLRVLRTIAAERRRSRVAPSPVLPLDETVLDLTDNTRGPSPTTLDLRTTRTGDSRAHKTPSGCSTSAPLDPIRASGASSGSSIPFRRTSHRGPRSRLPARLGRGGSYRRN